MTKLIDAIKQLDRNETIKVGAESGACFFFVGCANDFLKNVGDYSAKAQKAWGIAYKTAYKQETEVINKYPTLSMYAEDERKRENAVFSYDGYIREVNLWFKKVKRAYDHKRDLKERYEGFEPFDKREVVSIFDADEVVEPDGVKVILIAGYEMGTFWASEEAIKKPAFGIRQKQEDD